MLRQTGPDFHSTPVVAVRPGEIVVPKNAATGEMNNGRMIPTASLRILQEGVEISQDASQNSEGLQRKMVGRTWSRGGSTTFSFILALGHANCDMDAGEMRPPRPQQINSCGRHAP